jgi:hypothetical protein
MINDPILITGMHRAGTSMVARILNLCGLGLGPEDRMIGSPVGGVDNPKGFWENREIVTLNDDILRWYGGTWDEPVYIPKTIATCSRHDNWLDRAITEAVLIPVGSSGKCGLKDPRFCLLHRFWGPLFPTAKVVVCKRYAPEVAESLQARNGGTLTKWLGLWQIYNTEVLNYPNRTVVEFTDLFEDSHRAVTQLLDQLGIHPTTQQFRQALDSIDPELRHHDIIRDYSSPQ